MNLMVKVSVIIPVYNGEKFIEKCINSILNGTYQNFELIVINDGSKDNSLKVLKKFDKNKKIRIYSQKNHGASYTRNIGLKKAIGKYVTFIDCDDYVEPDYLEQYIHAFKKNTNIVLGGYTKIIKNKRKTTRPSFCSWDVYRFSATCGKMYEKEFLEKNMIKYGNTEFLKDVILNLNCLFKNANYEFINYAGYNYVYNADSISNNYGRKPEQIINIFEIIKYIDCLAHESGYNDSLHLINYYVNTYLFMVFICCRKADYLFLKKMLMNS